MAIKTIYKKTSRTGGGADAADGIDGAVLKDESLILVFESNRVLIYEVDLTGGAAANDPHILVPVTNPGTVNLVLFGVATKLNTSPKSVTIAAGVLTPTGPGNYLVDTEGAAASDEVTSVAGLATGETAILSIVSDARVVTVENNASIKLQGMACSLVSQYNSIQIQGLAGDVVRELTRSGAGS